jgi:glycosyltransferase involved in cell wall biosynthesis
MAGRPLVSVITPTWQRQDLLLEAMANVRAQTYRPIEHVIVSDGQHPGLEWLVKLDGAYRASGDHVAVTFVELGRNWSTFLPESFCAAPNVVGQLVARGEYQAFLADDERMDPDHVASLVDALEAAGADFAYGRVRMWWAGTSPERGWEIGAPSPQCGQITNALYRTDLLKRGLYPFGAGMTSDWACISQWMDKGATWAYVDRVTLTHRVDH